MAGLRADSVRGATRDTTFDRLDETRAQSIGGNDGVDRPNLKGSLNAVDRVELRGDFAELLGSDGRAHIIQFSPQSAAVRVPC